MNCKEILEQGAAACVECGTLVGPRSKNTSIASETPVTTIASNRNTLSYHEDRNSRRFEASLTDPAMQGLGDVFGEFFAQRGAARAGHPNGRFDSDGDLLSRKALPPTPPRPPSSEDIEPRAAPSAASEEPQGKTQLLKIFTIKGESFELSDNRLKAKSGAEYLRRLTYLFLYTHEVYGRPSVNESEVKRILKSAKVWDDSGNANRWLNKRIGISDDEDEKVKLTATGREEAVKTLKEVLDQNILDEWNPDKNTPKPRKKKA